MSLAEVGEDGQNYTPNADKECQGEQKNLPLGNPGAPQEGPVSPVRLGNRTVSVRH